MGFGCSVFKKNKDYIFYENPAWMLTADPVFEDAKVWLKNQKIIGSLENWSNLQVTCLNQYSKKNKKHFWSLVIVK